MENTSKALLIAAAVLIVILIVTFGIKIFSSSRETLGQEQQVGEVMSSISKEAVDKIIINDKEAVDKIIINDKDNNKTEATIIQFKIEGDVCYAEKGMSWETWVNSKYNTKGVYIFEDEETLAVDGYELQINGSTIYVEVHDGPQLNLNLRKAEQNHPTLY